MSRVKRNSQNLRENLYSVDKPTGIAGEAMLRANTTLDQQQLLGVGRRNIIINGDMRIAQRGTTFSGGSAKFGADRFESSFNASGSTTVSQQSDGPYTPDGHFKYYYQINVDSPDTSIATTDYGGIFYKVEGYDIACAGFGSTYAKTLTLSFWHAHSQPGVYSVSMRNDGGGSNRNFVFDYRQEEANVWQKTTVTFQADQGGTWTDANSAGLSIFWTYTNGTQYQASTLNQWFAGTYYHSSQNIDNMLGTTNAKFRLTGVQLELGSVATPFEHRGYGEELLRCKRYYERYTDPSAADRLPSAGGWTGVLLFRWEIEKRGIPSFVNYVDLEIRDTTNVARAITGTTGINEKYMLFLCANSDTAGATFRFTTTSGYLEVDAEL
jgi:hypothetical protein